MRVAGLFAGIAGLERGLEEQDFESVLFCECDPGAQQVLRYKYPDVPFVSDVRDIDRLPADTQLVTAGFPCQDLSQAGGTRGINGSKSGIVEHLFRILAKHDVPHVLIENVPFMLQLQKGSAIQFVTESLARLGYNWAYRVVDARAFGLPQRRERVFILASRQTEPWHALFEEAVMPAYPAFDTKFAVGFYWTEGTRGLGWAVDAVPTLKGGSTVGIPSPPAIWLPNGRIVKPSLQDAERLQGFPADWTLPAELVARTGYRWKLVGNAVSVRTASWVGRRILNLETGRRTKVANFPILSGKSWPSAAYGTKDGARCGVKISTWPRKEPQEHLEGFLGNQCEDLSFRAVSGFLKRLQAGTLRYPPEFLRALIAHKSRMEELEQHAV